MMRNTVEVLSEVLRRIPMNVLDQACAEASEALEILPMDGEDVVDAATDLRRALCRPNDRYPR